MFTCQNVNGRNALCITTWWKGEQFWAAQLLWFPIVACKSFQHHTATLSGLVDWLPRPAPLGTGHAPGRWDRPVLEVGKAWQYHAIPLFEIEMCSRKMSFFVVDNCYCSCDSHHHDHHHQHHHRHQLQVAWLPLLRVFTFKPKRIKASTCICKKETEPVSRPAADGGIPFQTNLRWDSSSRNIQDAMDVGSFRNTTCPLGCLHLVAQIVAIKGTTVRCLVHLRHHPWFRLVCEMAEGDLSAAMVAVAWLHIDSVQCQQSVAILRKTWKTHTFSKFLKSVVSDSVKTWEKKCQA